VPALRQRTAWPEPGDLPPDANSEPRQRTSSGNCRVGTPTGAARRSRGTGLRQGLRRPAQTNPPRRTLPPGRGTVPHEGGRQTRTPAPRMRAGAPPVGSGGNACTRSTWGDRYPRDTRSWRRPRKAAWRTELSCDSRRDSAIPRWTDVSTPTNGKRLGVGLPPPRGARGRAGPGRACGGEVRAPSRPWATARSSATAGNTVRRSNDPRERLRRHRRARSAIRHRLHPGGVLGADARRPSRQRERGRRRLAAGGLDSLHRGELTIVDRSGLEAASCPCYRTIRDEFDRLLGPRPWWSDAHAVTDRARWLCMRGPAVSCGEASNGGGMEAPR